ncbi:hypothetical protein IM697_42135 [Streptomyces ferrugineus]|uniref:Secreted protein n=1 Tax=Streptomyces ferrugineus TaxID=1413221 RepID=A0A7M2T0X6_9ACTN|nr:hypothetical protein [Streptomyces ferrugineus]QOV41545.1 hypothetical protein IM697_42135 [Streptomyces ferrugineus]
MPRGRHRHSPPLHRLLPPSAIAGVSVVCALAPWVFTEAMVLRGLAGAAAATAVVGAVVMRRWDTQAGKQVADLTRARASDEWRHEERVAELETDLEESRELRVKLEQRLRGKRAELAGLRNEHAALLRRYATSETERASVLEERRVLEIEAAAPAKALPAGPVDGAGEGAAGAETTAEAGVEVEAGAVAASASGEVEVEVAAEADDVAEGASASGVFSPEGSRLFLRAKAALARFDEDGTSAGDEPVSAGDEPVSAEDESAEGEPGVGESARDVSLKSESAKDGSPKDEPPNDGPPKGDGPSDGEPVEDGSEGVEAEGAGGSETEPALEDDPQGKSGAVDGHEHAAAVTPARSALPAAQQPSGHFIAPTAVAVAPATPVRRPAVEGGFDFFGTKKGAAHSALQSVQNEDLADVVGQEALALHKAESEAEFKPADEESRGVGQVIDLTAHDETEQIDVQGLRSAVS